MGPITLIDKSSFQAFNSDQVLQFIVNFDHSLPPILLFEIIGDLKRKEFGDLKNRARVSNLANRFFGSGPPINETYNRLSIGELLGGHVPMTGAVIAQGARKVAHEDGYGIFIDITPFNEAIMRWTEGKFTDEDFRMAIKWRNFCENTGTEVLEDLFTEFFVIPAKCNNLDAVKEEAERILYMSSLQEPLLQWFIRRLAIDSTYQSALMARFVNDGRLLGQYAPYTSHCIKTMLCLMLAERNKLIRKSKTNIIDMHYLLYLPFCFVFVSDDTTHKRLAPLLLRNNQSFVTGQQLRNSLSKHMEIWNNYSEKKRKTIRYILGSHPYPIKDSVVSTLWSKHMKPWSGPNSYIAKRPPEKDVKEGVQEVTKLFVEAGLRIAV